MAGSEVERHLEHVPPPERRPILGRIGAPIGMLAVFWLDIVAPPSLAIPTLYVVPTVFFLGGGRFWEPLAVAAASTVLAVVGAYVGPAGEAESAPLNRLLAVLIFWTSATLVATYRLTVERWNKQADRDSAALQNSLTRLEEIRYALDQAAIVATTDQRGVITYVNDKFCEISKYSRAELLGQDHRIINSAYHSKEFIRDLWRTIAQGRIWRGEIRNRAKDGTYYWVDTTIVPFLDDRGKPRQYLAIRSDITQRKMAEARLLDQAGLAQLGQMAAVVAHEVRNPLAGVRGSLQVLRSRLPADFKERGIVDAMMERIDTLNTKVQDLLMFARPRSPVLRAVELGPLVAEAASSAQAAVGTNCHGIAISGDRAVAIADTEMLRAVLLNVLINACQAGGREPVEVVTSMRDGACSVTVLDRGPGIAPDLHHRIFDAFFTTKRGGTGLGLAIVKRLMELQNGTVVLGPREGGGTTAEITLPTPPEAVAKSTSLSQVGLPPAPPHQ